MGTDNRKNWAACCAWRGLYRSVFLKRKLLFSIFNCGAYHANIFANFEFVAQNAILRPRYRLSFREKSHIWRYFKGQFVKLSYGTLLVKVLAYHANIFANFEFVAQNAILRPTMQAYLLQNCPARRFEAGNLPNCPTSKFCRRYYHA